MERFYFIHYPEQIFNLKQKIEGGIPVLSFFPQLSDLNRIASSFKRWEIPVGIFYDRNAYPLKQFLTQADQFNHIFTFDPDTVKALRDTGFQGAVYLFSNFRMLVHGGFFKELDTVPVVSGKANFELAVSIGLKPVYYVSDRMCIADFGLCISRKGTVQGPFNCDGRCREKSRSKPGLECPLSIKPELTVPDGSSYIVFSERPFFPNVKNGELRDQILERCWNYRYPVGIEILKPGKTGNGKNFVFSLDAKTEKLFDKGLLDFFGYTGAMYKGKWAEGAKAKKNAEGKLSVSVNGSFESLLMVHRYTEEELDFLKKARHFIYTLPEKKFIEEIDDEDAVNEIPVGEKHPRKYSGRAKLTLISDDVKKFNAFKGRDVEKKVFIYKRGMNLNFSDYLYIPQAVSAKDFDDISQMRKLKGIVVADGIMREAFERLFPEKEVMLHPLAYFDPQKAPSYISAFTTIFVSRFTTDKRSGTGWTDLNIFLKNQQGYTELISKKKLTRSGGRRELWVNIADITDDALHYLKSQAETILRKVR